MIYTIMNICYFAFYFILVFLVARSDLKKREIDKRILVYGVLANVAISIAQYALDGQNLSRLILYLSMIAILELVSIELTRKHKKWDYQVTLLVVLLLFNLFSFELVSFLTVGCTLIVTGLDMALGNTFNKKKSEKRIPVGFYLSVTNVIALVSIYMYTMMSI